MLATLGIAFMFLASAAGATASTTKKPSCQYPPQNAVPENCCSFPDLFPDSIVNQCEKDFGSKNNASEDEGMLADSCVIECAFNKSGLNNAGKLQRDDVIKVFMNRTASDKSWNPLITKAIKTCFDELSPEAIDEFVQSFAKDFTSLRNKKTSSAKLCHPVTSFVLDCTYLELFKVCPADKFTASDSICVELKKYTNDCDDW